MFSPPVLESGMDVASFSSYASSWDCVPRGAPDASEVPQESTKVTVEHLRYIKQTTAEPPPEDDEWSLPDVPACKPFVELPHPKDDVVSNATSIAYSDTPFSEVRDPKQDVASVATSIAYSNSAFSLLADPKDDVASYYRSDQSDAPFEELPHPRDDVASHNTSIAYSGPAFSVLAHPVDDVQSLASRDMWGQSLPDHYPRSPGSIASDLPSVPDAWEIDSEHESDGSEDRIDPTWNCPACTYINSLSRNTCEMCGTVGAGREQLHRDEVCRNLGFSKRRGRKRKDPSELAERKCQQCSLRDKSFACCNGHCRMCCADPRCSAPRHNLLRLKKRHGARQKKWERRMRKAGKRPVALAPIREVQVPAPPPPTPQELLAACLEGTSTEPSDYIRRKLAELARLTVPQADAEQTMTWVDQTAKQFFAGPSNPFSSQFKAWMKSCQLLTSGAKEANYSIQVRWRNWNHALRHQKPLQYLRNTVTRDEGLWRARHLKKMEPSAASKESKPAWDGKTNLERLREQRQLAADRAQMMTTMQKCVNSCVGRASYLRWRRMGKASPPQWAQTNEEDYSVPPPPLPTEPMAHREREEKWDRETDYLRSMHFGHMAVGQYVSRADPNETYTPDQFRTSFGFSVEGFKGLEHDEWPKCEYKWQPPEQTLLRCREQTDPVRDIRIQDLEQFDRTFIEEARAGLQNVRNDAWDSRETKQLRGYFNERYVREQKWQKEREAEAEEERRRLEDDAALPEAGTCHLRRPGTSTRDTLAGRCWDIDAPAADVALPDAKPGAGQYQAPRRHGKVIATIAT